MWTLENSGKIGLGLRKPCKRPGEYGESRPPASTHTQDTGNTPVGSTVGYALGQQLWLFLSIWRA